jgi:hypothetical protein
MDSFRSEEMIKDFCRQLRGQGVSSAASARHRDKLRFFLHAYLAEEWPRDLDRVDGQIVRDFLGSWFPRHVGGAKADLAAFLTTFKKFYQFLYLAGRLSTPEFDELELVLNTPDYFYDRFDEYFTPTDGLDDLEEYGPADIPAEPVPGYRGPLDRQLWILAANLDRPEAPAGLDFALFLDYLAGLPVKLTRKRKSGAGTDSHANFPARHAARINARFSRPEEIPAGGTSRRIAWFYHVARVLDLVRVGEKGELMVRPRAEAFLDLPASAQLAILIDATWNLVPWSQLGTDEMAEVSEWAQLHRDGFAALLADLSPDQECPLDLDASFDRQDALLARYIYFHDVVEAAILFAMREMGLLNYAAFPDEVPRPFNLQSITLTRFGRQVMRLFTRRAFRGAAPEASPLRRLQQSLLSH